MESEGKNTGSKLAEAISQGTEAINKLVQSGEIEELREVVGMNAEQEETEDYLQDDGEIDFSKVPDVELPTPLASSKFAQNPELLKVLNRGGKHKLNQLLGWNDGGANDRKFKIYQPVYSGLSVEDLHDQGSDSSHYNSDKTVCKKNSTDAHDKTLNRKIFDNSKTMSVEDHLEFNISKYREIPDDTCREKDSRIDYQDSETRQGKNSFHNIQITTSDKDSNSGSYWNKDLSSLKKSDMNISHENIMKREGKQMDCTGSEMHFALKSQITSDFSLSNNASISNVSQNSSKNSLHSRIDGNPSHVAQQHNMNATFRPSGPPPQLTNNFNSHFRNPSNNNFVPNAHFRPVGPFPTQMPFNNFPGPPPNYRMPNPSFDRGTFGGSNFRGQSSIQPPGSMSNSYNNNFGNFSGKNGPNRGSSTNRVTNDNSRTNFNGRGRGRDHDQSRGTRGRDNY